MVSKFVHWAQTLWFFALFLLALDTVFGSLYRNGYLEAVARVSQRGWKYYPDTDLPILEHMTRLRPWDTLNKLGLVMFANIFDGSTPDLSIFAFQFAGCLLPLLTIIALEGIRRGNQGTILCWSALWGMLLQFPGYGVVMPVYALYHLSSSRTTGTNLTSLRSEIRPLSIFSLQTFIPSLVLTYLVPTAVVTMPLSWFAHQWALALWQGFPLWFYLLQRVFVLARRSFHTLHDQDKVTAKKEADRGVTLHHLETVYRFTIAVSGLIHISTIATICFYPRTFFYKQSWEASVSFQKVYLPRSAWTTTRMESMGSAMLNSFKYDELIGIISTISWAAILWARSQQGPLSWRELTMQATKVLGISIAAGPGVAFTCLMWDRDSKLASSWVVTDSKTS